MALALTAFRAGGIDLIGPTRKRGLQRIVLEFTAAATDVDLDLGDLDGTFWGAVDATAMGAQALEVVTRIVAQAAAFLSVHSPQLADRQKVLAADIAAGKWYMTLENSMPNITLNAADGETAWYIEVVQELNDGISPVFFECKT